MKNLVCVFSILIVGLPLNAQNTYSIENIPDSLKENANVVYFVKEANFEILSDNKAIYRVHTVAAILNSKGKRHAAQSIGYDKLTKINSFSGAVYNQDGKEIKKLKKSEIVDQSNVSGFSLYEDDRVQYADLKQNSYPYIVEFSYVQEFKYTYYIPSWYSLPGENASVMKSYYKILAPKELRPNLKLVNTNKKLVISENEQKVEIIFQLSNLKALEKEINSPPFRERYPILYASPSNFNYSGYKGDMSSWESYGRWISYLNKGRADLPQQTVMEIQKIVNAFDSREDKIHAVYQYVQDKTRYVSIQLGIGGYQPFPATTVDELGYGDCKALSNYTFSLLKAVGIPSNYALVYAGDNPPELDPQFADNRFNHAILCVPNKQDSIWLECTSQTNPYGYMGTNTGDRDVMLVTEEGGKIVHTPIYKKEHNTQHTKAIVEVNKEGKASASVQIVYAGLQYENSNLNWYVDYSEEEQKKWIYKNTQIADFTVQDFRFRADKNRIPSITQNMKVEIPRLARPNGSRVFLGLNLLNKSTYIPKKYEERKTDLVLDFQGVDTDTLVYTIPENLHPEYLPKPIEIASEFGKYKSSVKFENGKLVYVRRREFNKGRFAKEKYDSYRKYCKDVVKADKTKAVFIDKT